MVSYRVARRVFILTVCGAAIVTAVLVLSGHVLVGSTAVLAERSLREARRASLRPPTPARPLPSSSELDCQSDALSHEEVSSAVPSCSISTRRSARTREEAHGHRAARRLKIYPKVKFRSHGDRKRILITAGRVRRSHLADRLMLEGHEVPCLAKRVGARILIASTSEVYGDPRLHPSPSPTGDTSTQSVQQCSTQLLHQYKAKLRALEKKLTAIELRAGSKFYPKVKFRSHGDRKRILITGGAGFVGSHLADRLMLEGHEVTVVDNLYTGRKRNVEQWLGHENFELFIHDIINTFYAGSLAKRVGARILIASTSEVYGDPEVHPQPESYWGHVNPIGPRACYDEAKRVAETLAFAYQKQSNVSIGIARIFNTYGPRMHNNDGRVVSNFVLQALQNKTLTIYGSGEQTRSFQYVSDLVEGLVALMESGHTGPVNLGNPVEHTIEEFAHIIRQTVGGTSEVEYLDAVEDDPQKRKPDIRRAKELLNWEPKVPLSEGIPKTVEFFKNELSRKGHSERNRFDPLVDWSHITDGL
ncbi:UDP-glucuronic acid decarboxylase 1 [Amphibalanus amphitrite]|uniref:UDP-glucuronate decarboxylase n=1 Tax=Amphibalanus amphitrite TaxID=1232801 RepID=A0A6A4UWV8_AMPAM|nr:UDP-glucuronic acid decarboxylase 1 [Amphibalanus amphitrite]KAF0288237.1 UDP-glucuronic acid decarboxylase 1 [Amphibalanus amphitrite]